MVVFLFLYFCFLYYFKKGQMKFAVDKRDDYLCEFIIQLKDKLYTYETHSTSR